MLRGRGVARRAVEALTPPIRLRKSSREWKPDRRADRYLIARIRKVTMDASGADSYPCWRVDHLSPLCPPATAD
jgi:hypothetical protein